MNQKSSFLLECLVLLQAVVPLFLPPMNCFVDLNSPPDLHCACGGFVCFAKNNAKQALSVRTWIPRSNLG